MDGTADPNVAASAEMPQHYLQNVIRDSTDDFAAVDGIQNMGGAPH